MSTTNAPTLAGFAPGAPVHVRRETQAIDRDLCRRLRCGTCHRRGLTYHPYHKGRIYRVLAVCACGASEEI